MDVDMVCVCLMRSVRKKTRILVYCFSVFHDESFLAQTLLQLYICLKREHEHMTGYAEGMYYTYNTVLHKVWVHELDLTPVVFMNPVDSG